MHEYYVGLVTGMLIGAVITIWVVMGSMGV